MRLFLAIPLAPEVIDGLEQLSRSLRSVDQRLRWTSAESWHITLQFLGETSKERYDCLVPRLREVVSDSLLIQVGDLGFFDRSGVFFADVLVSPGLGQLERSVIRATAKCGCAAEERPFHPHITLARAKGDDRVHALRKLKNSVKSNLAFAPFTATEFLLYESFLDPRGSRYDVRERFPIASR
jgi:RNA 2',3'-cyclic 3'-phosphodiesterase